MHQELGRNERLRRTRRLLDILSECEDEQFSSFCEALITDGQRHIVDTYLRRDNTADQQRQRQHLGKRPRVQGNFFHFFRDNLTYCNFFV